MVDLWLSWKASLPTGRKQDSPPFATENLYQLYENSYSVNDFRPREDEDAPGLKKRRKVIPTAAKRNKVPQSQEHQDTPRKKRRKMESHVVVVTKKN